MFKFLLQLFKRKNKEENILQKMERKKQEMEAQLQVLKEVEDKIKKEIE